jgi:hypothetical protein
LVGVLVGVLRAPVAVGTTGVVVASVGVGLTSTVFTGAGEAAPALGAAVLAGAVVMGGVVVTGTMGTAVTMGSGAVVLPPAIVDAAGAGLAGSVVVVVVPALVAGTLRFPMEALQVRRYSSITRQHQVGNTGKRVRH